MPLPRNFRLDADKRARLGSQLLRLAKRYERALSERLSPWGLSSTHYEILKYLYAAPDYSMTHSRIAEAAGITQPSVTLAMRKLAAAGLVGHRRGEDRRQRVASLSVKGAEVLALLYDANEGFAEDLFSALPDKTAEKVGEAIAALLGRLQSLEENAANRA